jgi:hypothetical protein
MNGSAFWLLVPQVVVGVFAWGCANGDGTGRIGDNAVVPSRPGIVQVGGAHDPVIDETTACFRFRAALQSNVERLQCATVPVGDCPALVHPLVEWPCVMYSEPSVAQCEAIFAQASSCADLGLGSCVLTAILDPTDANGVPLECPERDSSSGVPADSGATTSYNSETTDERSNSATDGTGSDSYGVTSNAESNSGAADSDAVDTGAADSDAADTGAADSGIADSSAGDASAPMDDPDGSDADASL